MAIVMWSDLPADILLLVAKILSSDVDTIRLRSICSHWRNSIRRRYRPSSFPLQVPPIFSHQDDALRRGVHYFLHYATLYRFSPPEFGPYAGDPSDGYLLRVAEVNPNNFVLVPLLRFGMPKSDLTLAVKHVNLLDFRVSEICKPYTVDCLNPGVMEDTAMYFIAKVIVLWDYDVDCDFAVLVLLKQGFLYYWKFGDKDWSPVTSNGCSIESLDDVVLHDGKCYAISRQGVLVFVDSKFNLNVAPLLPPLPVDDCNETVFYLVDYNSELYVVSKFYDQGKCNPNCSKEIALEVKIFKKSSSWEYIKCLGDDVFVLCVDVSFGVSVKDFSGCKGNSVYFSPEKLLPYRGRDNKIVYAVHDLDEGRTLVRKLGKGPTLIYRPPPKWLSSS